MIKEYKVIYDYIKDDRKNISKTIIEYTNDNEMKFIKCEKIKIKDYNIEMKKMGL